MCKFKNIMNIKKTDFNNQHSFKCIAYLHEKHIIINKECLKNKIKLIMNLSNKKSKLFIRKITTLKNLMFYYVEVCLF